MNEPKAPIRCVALFAFCCAYALLWTYGWCMVDPNLPDYYSRKFRMMFDMRDPGLLSVPALIGLVACLAFLLPYFVLYLKARRDRK